jgi:hypothetical protein
MIVNWLAQRGKLEPINVLFHFLDSDPHRLTKLIHSHIYEYGRLVSKISIVAYDKIRL